MKPLCIAIVACEPLDAAEMRHVQGGYINFYSFYVSDLNVEPPAQKLEERENKYLAGQLLRTNQSSGPSYAFLW